MLELVKTLIGFFGQRIVFHLVLLAAIPGLATSNLVANATYEFEAVMIMNKNSGTAGLKLAIDIPTGATITAVMIAHTTGTTVITNIINADATLNATAFATAANVDSVAVIKGTILNGANATAVQMMQAAVTSQTSRAQIGSTLKIRRVN